MHRFISLLLTSGCAIGSPDVDVHSSSVVLGARDLVPVLQDGSNVPARYRYLYDAIGRMSPSICTVSHVGNGIAITAGHCFKNGDYGTIEWGVRASDHPQGYLVSEVTRVIAKRWVADEQTDYAIIAVAPAPNAAVPIALTRPAQNTTTTIFSHPHYRPLEWSQLCKRGALSNATVFRHSCDTEPGSSGAAVFDDTTLRVYGIHNGGHADDYNYGTFLADTPLADILAGSPPPSDPPPHDEPSSGEVPGTVATIDNAYVPQGEWIHYGPYQVASGQTLRIVMSGSGDADLYVRKGQPTDGVVSDCKSENSSSSETCSVGGPAAAYVSVYGYTAATFSLAIALQ